MARQILETLAVPVTSGTLTHSVTVTEMDKLYLIRLFGTATYHLNGNFTDGIWSHDPYQWNQDVWRTHFNLNFQINEEDVPLLPYNPKHEYWFVFEGTGEPISFRLRDDPYNDNAGSLHIEISPYVPGQDGEGYCPITYIGDKVFKGNPIALQDGEKSEEITDLSLNTPAGLLTLTRTYRQSKLDDPAYQFMGQGWTHNHQISLSEAAGTIVVQLPNGGRAYFVQSNPATHYEGDVGSNSAIDIDNNSTSARYVLTAADQSRYVFDGDRQLRTHSWPQGESWNYSWNNGKLTEVNDGYNRKLVFRYYPTGNFAGLLWRVGDHTFNDSNPNNLVGRYVQYNYIFNKKADLSSGTTSAETLLAEVCDPRGQFWTYDYYGQDSTETDVRQLNRLIERRSPSVDTNGDGQNDTIVTLEKVSYSWQIPDVQLAQDGGMELPVSNGKWPGFNAPYLNRQESVIVDSGTYSREVGASAAGQGIEQGQSWSLTPGKIYTISAKVYVQSGTVQMQVTGVFNFDRTTGGSGAWELLRAVYVPATSSSGHKLQFVAAGGPAQFYVDTVSIIEADLGIPDMVQERGDAALVTEFAFQPSGNTVTTETIDGKEITHHFIGGVYDGVELPGSNGNYASQLLDGRFRPYRQQDAKGNSTYLKWDARGKQLQSVTDALGYDTSFAYDNGDRLIASIDALGRRTAYSYDAANRQPSLVLVQDIQNLIVDGGMELDSGWASVGTPLTNEQSDEQVDSGSYSRQVVSNVADQGIQSEQINLVAGRIYLIRARVYVVSGRVKMQLAGITSEEAVSSTQNTWETLQIACFPTNNVSNVRLQFVGHQRSGQTSEFFVDTVSVSDIGADLAVNGGMELNSDWTGFNSPVSNVRSNTQVDSGSYSWHVVANAADQGIQGAAWSWLGSCTYIVVARVYPVSGKVKMQVTGRPEFDRFSDGNGKWQTLCAIYTTFGASTGRRLQFVAGDGPAEFYVDSVHILESPDLLQVQEFRVDHKGRSILEATLNPLDGGLERQLTRHYATSGDGNGLLQRLEQHDAQQPNSTINTEYTYDTFGRVVKTAQSSTFGSCQYSYTVYDEAGNVEATVCGRQNTTPPTTVAAAIAMYDANDLVKRDNRVTVHKYDSLGRRIETILNAGSVFDQTSLTFYDGLNRVWRTISNYINQSGGGVEAPGNWVWNTGRTRWEKSASDPTPISHGNDSTQNLIQDMVYNARGLVESQMDVAGKVTRLIYNDAGQAARTIINYVPQGIPASDPADWVWDVADSRWEYGTGLAVDHGNNDQNLITEQVFDAVGNLVKTVDVLRNVTFTSYDALNRPKKTIRNASQVDYDILANPDFWGYVYATTVDEDLIEEIDYDAMGRVIRSLRLVDRQQSVERWDATLYGYNSLGQQVKLIRSASDLYYLPDHLEDDPDLSEYSEYVDNPSFPDQDIVSITAYDEAGRVLYTEDALHRKTYFVYDGFGRPIRTISNYVPQGNPVVDPAQWVWDAADQRWEYSNTNNTPIEHGIENDQNLIQESFYDSDGKVLESHNVMGQLTRNVYDEQGRVVFTITNYTVQKDSQNRTAYPNDWYWDATANVWKGVTKDTANPPNILETITIQHGSENDQNIITEPLYDALGRVQATRDELGRIRRNVYDDLGRVIRLVTNYVDQGEDPKLWVWNNGWKKSDSTTPIDHDSDYEPDQNIHQNIVSSTVYEAQGRVLQTVDQRNNVTLYIYDRLGRRVTTISNYLPQTDTQSRIADPGDWYWDTTAKVWKGITKDTATPPNILETITIEHGADNDQNQVSTTSYDLAGHILNSRDPAGRETHFEYDLVGRRTKTILNYLPQSGNTPANWVWETASKRWEDGSGNPINLGAACDQNLISDMRYSLAGLMVATRDPRGTQTVFTYDKAGRRKTVTYAADTALASQTYTCYDKVGQVLRTLSNYVPIRAGFDIPPEAVDADGNISPDARDGDWNWWFEPEYHILHKDQNLLVNYFYDGVGRRLRSVSNYVRQGTSNPLNWVWNAGAIPPRWEYSNTDTTPVQHGVDSDHNLVSSTRYFRNGSLQSMTDSEGMVTQYRYDALGRRTRVVQAYLAQSGSDPKNWTWDIADGRWEYPTNNAVAHGTNNDRNIIVLLSYDRAGRILSQRDPRGSLTSYQYDLLDRRKTLTNPISKTWSTVYTDLVDGKTRVTLTYPGISGASNYPVQRDFDRLGRLVSIQYTDSMDTPHVRFSYDEESNRSQMSEYSRADFTNRIRETSFHYDNVRRLTSVEFDNNGNGSVDETVSYEYDAGGRRTKLTMPDDLSITYIYDQRGQLISLTDWDDQQTQLAYDLAGRHIVTQRPNGLCSWYEYDASGRLRDLHHQERNKVLGRFQYRVDKRGNRKQVYEQVAHPATLITTLGKANAAVEYYQGTWSDAGDFKVTSQFEAAMRVTFTGNEARLTLGTGPDHSIFDIYIDGSLWESFDGYTDAIGERSINIYLSKGGAHVVNIRNRPERNVGNITEPPVYKVRFKQLEVLETAYDQQTIQYDYDAVSRLLDAKYYPGTNTGATLLRRHLFTYDRAGNRLSESIALNGGAPTVMNYVYNLANQLTSGGMYSYEYDFNGNLHYKKQGQTVVDTYTWDRGSRLQSFHHVNGQYQVQYNYKYDGLGNRIYQDSYAMQGGIEGFGPKHNYLLDLQPGLPVVLADTRDINSRYVHTTHGILAQKDEQNNWEWMVQDGLGSVRGVVSNTVDMLESRLYSPYGEPFGATGINQTPYGFTGEPTDDNGLLYLRARYYSPNLGVFTSLDPFEGIVDRQMSLNRYSWVGDRATNDVFSGHLSLINGYYYANGNPVNLVDPSGYCVTCEADFRIDIADAGLPDLRDERLEGFKNSHWNFAGDIWGVLGREIDFVRWMQNSGRLTNDRKGNWYDVADAYLTASRFAGERLANYIKSGDHCGDAYLGQLEPGVAEWAAFVLVADLYPTLVLELQHFLILDEAFVAGGSYSLNIGFWRAHNAALREGVRRADAASLRYQQSSEERSLINYILYNVLEPGDQCAAGNSVFCLFTFPFELNIGAYNIYPQHYPATEQDLDAIDNAFAEIYIAWLALGARWPDPQIHLIIKNMPPNTA